MRDISRPGAHQARLSLPAGSPHASCRLHDIIQGSPAPSVVAGLRGPSWPRGVWFYPPLTAMTGFSAFCRQSSQPRDGGERKEAAGIAPADHLTQVLRVTVIVATARGLIGRASVGAALRDLVGTRYRLTPSVRAAIHEAGAGRRVSPGSRSDEVALLTRGIAVIVAEIGPVGVPA
jgi:hypothetical protein